MALMTHLVIGQVLPGWIALFQMVTREIHAFAIKPPRLMQMAPLSIRLSSRGDALRPVAERMRGPLSCRYPQESPHDPATI